jgi:YihY family inner membrane protein
MANSADGERRRHGWHMASLWWRVLRTSYLRYYSIGSHFMAAAIAFYSLICLAPLGIIFVAIIQSLLGSERTAAARFLARTVEEYGGDATAQIMGQIEGFLANPGSHFANIASIVAVIWAGLRLFDVVQLSLTFIWPGRRLRTFVPRKLVSLAMMAAAGLLLGVLVLSRLTLAGLQDWLATFPDVDRQLLAPLRPLGSRGLSFAVTGVAYLMLYKTMPVQKVNTRAAIAGAVCAALLWQASLPIFLSLVRRSLEINPIYGSLGNVVLFGLWAFLGAQMLLYGAQFAAAYEHVMVHRRPRGEDDTFVEAARRRLQITRLPDLSAEAEHVLGELELTHQPPTPTATGRVNAIVLSSGRVNPHYVDRVGAEFKGLIPVAGRSSVEHVVNAIRGVARVGKLVIVGDREAYLHSAVGDRVEGIVEAGPDTAYNLLRAIRFLGEDRRVLIATDDTPLLTSEALSDFLDQCDPRADLCYPVARPVPTQRRLRRRHWAFLPLRDGSVTYTCHVLVDPRLVLRNQEFVDYFLSRQKDYLAAIGELGLGFVLRFLLSWYVPSLRYDLASTDHRIAAVTGAQRCQGVPLEHPEMAVGLDTPADVEAANAYLSSRDPGPGDALPAGPAPP